MADKIISKIKLPTGTDGAQETHIIKDREAADTRITEAEIAALFSNYTPDHTKQHLSGGNN